MDKYSEDKYDYDEEEDDFSEELSKYKHAKESSVHGKGGPPKDKAKRPVMKGQQQQQHQHQCMFVSSTCVYLPEQHTSYLPIVKTCPALYKLCIQ